ncbi:MAG: hypothetical protein ACJAZP_003812 [Psychromonas sp.]|jgi:hypothetical protein|uniref:hypothetical protein n=1 Tax=Psychromonas sp. TaxID=1884585 RepID=UPI0039E4EAA9
MAILNQQKKLDINQTGKYILIIEELSLKLTASVGSLLLLGAAFGPNVHSIWLVR